MPIYQYLDNQATTNDGAILGQTTSHKVGYYGTTPVVQGAAVTTVTTTAATTNTTNWGYSTSVQADAIVTAVNALIDRLKTPGFTA